MTATVAEERVVADAADGGYPNSVLGKVQLLLGAFESGGYQLKLTDLSRRAGVPKASAYRLAQELVQWGLLERRGDTYQLGMRLFELGQRVPAAAALRAVARPSLIDLFIATRASIHLAVLDGSHVLYLEKVAGQGNLDDHSYVGGRLPATCTATGKVLLAVTAAGAVTSRQFVDVDLVRFTSRSVASVAALHEQLAEVRRRGFAVEIEETMARSASIAVPVTGADGNAIAAVSATVPNGRLDVRRLLLPLQSTAAVISRSLLGRRGAQLGASSLVRAR